MVARFLGEGHGRYKNRHPQDRRGGGWREACERDARCREGEAANIAGGICSASSGFRRASGKSGGQDRGGCRREGRRCVRGRHDGRGAKAVAAIRQARRNAGPVSRNRWIALVRATAVNDRGRGLCPRLCRRVIGSPEPVTENHRRRAPFNAGDANPESPLRGDPSALSPACRQALRIAWRGSRAERDAFCRALFRPLRSGVRRVPGRTRRDAEMLFRRTQRHPMPLSRSLPLPDPKPAHPESGKRRFMGQVSGVRQDAASIQSAAIFSAVRSVRSPKRSKPSASASN